MLIKLTLNSKKAEQYNQRARELKIEYPDMPWREVENSKMYFAFIPNL